MEADKRSIKQWLEFQSHISYGEFCYRENEAVEILRDIFNEDYSVKEFQNDVLAYFEPNNREEK